MIVDLLKNADLYGGINSRLSIALKYLQTTDLEKLQIGKHEIMGSEIFAVVSEYNSKSFGEAKWEAHQKYADIQVLISGEEKMGYAHLQTMKITESYNSEKDIVFLDGHGDYINAKPGAFVIFFPHDAHQPGVAVNGSIPVKKVVVKVLM
jgi:YhcH/YjgK/YiaL family protein